MVSTMSASAPPHDQALGVRLEAVADGGVRDVAEGRQLGAGAHGAEHPALLTGGRGELVGDLAGDARARLGQFVHALGDVVLAEGRRVGAEGVGLDAVDAHGEVRLVHRAHDVRPGQVEDLVAAFEVLEVRERGVLGLEHGAHGTVGHHHAGGERLTEGCGSGPAVGGRGRRRGHGCTPWDATAVGFASSAEGAPGQGSRAATWAVTLSHEPDGILLAGVPAWRSAADFSSGRARVGIDR